MQYEEMISEKQAKRLIERMVQLGHSVEEANETLVYVMGAEYKEDKKEEAPQPHKQ